MCKDEAVVVALEIHKGGVEVPLLHVLEKGLVG